MRTLVTGATGSVGNALCKALLTSGHEVRAVVRDERRARPLLPDAVELLRGDVTEPVSLRQPMQGIDWVFHSAGIIEIFQRDEETFDRVNHVGTDNVLAAAHAAGVGRVIHTSTMDVFAAPIGGTVVETTLETEPRRSAYERSKQNAEKAAERWIAEGLDVVFVNPSAIYGPSPSNTGLNEFFIKMMRGKLPALPPGGMSIVYVDGVTQGHMKAAEHGKTGERYLLSDTHASNLHLAREVAACCNRRVPPTAPAWLLRPMASAGVALARRFDMEPLLTPGQLDFALWNVVVNSEKAQRELDFVPTPLAEGVDRTIAFLRETGAAP